MTDPFSLKDRTAAVVGAASGIGEAVAVGLARAGARVHCLDIDLDSAQAVSDGIVSSGGRSEAAYCDVTDSSSLETSFEAALARGGRLDIVVSTPAINFRKPLLEYSDDEFDRVIEVNLKGGFHVLKAAGSRMAEQGSGSVILFSSIRSLTVEPGQSVYAATKSGIVQLVRTAAAELGSRGVRVNAIAPGVVDTPLTRQIRADTAWSSAYAAKTVLGRWARADEMAGPAVFLASDASSYITGAVLFVDGGWTAVDGRFEPPGM